MKILLVYLCDYKDRSDYFTSLLPYGLSSMASYLEEKGFHVTLANLSAHGYKKGGDYIAGEKPDMLGVSIFTFNRVESLKLIRYVRKKVPETMIVAGGPHVSALAEETAARYSEIDWIIRGEGEAALYSLLERIKAGDYPSRIIDGSRLADLDRIPAASAFSGRLKDVNINEQYKYIITSRGCPHNCSYCSSPGFWGREVQFRSAGNIFNEIEYLYKKHGIIYFSIRDDNFTLSKKRVIEFCRKLRDSGVYIIWNCQSRVDTIDLEMLVEMKLAGLEHIQYGIESGSERVLREYDKSISIEKIEKAAEITRSAGVYLSVYLMCGMTGENRGDIRKTSELIKRIKPSDGMVSPVAYYPGTSLYEKNKKNGKISDDIWFKNDEPGIFLRNDRFVPESMETILEQLEAGGERWMYKENDFAGHRELTGENCWVTDILEADYFRNVDNYASAESLFRRVIERFPENIWGHYRMGRLLTDEGKPEEAVKFYRASAERVPRFYGSWRRLAEAFYILKDYKRALKYAEKAHSLNYYHLETTKLLRSIKSRV